MNAITKKRIKFASLVIALIAATSLLSFCQSSNHSWTIRLQGEDGPISSHTTRADLGRQFGAANVTDKDVDVGEGETEHGTVVFPNDPKRMIQILWKDGHLNQSTKSAQVDGDSSLWKAEHGVVLGTSLKELETLNQKPFKLFGFDWDYAGTVSSWEDGSLSKDLAEHGRVVVRLNYQDRSQIKDDELQQVSGESEFSSQHLVMQKINPRVYQLIWIFE
jgi:hypothetical protein